MESSQISPIQNKFDTPVFDNNGVQIVPQTTSQNNTPTKTTSKGLPVF